MNEQKHTLCHARWLTLGTRIICTYMRSKKPTRKLKVLTEFVLRCYANIWLKARLNPRATEVPRIYYEWIMLIQSFPNDVKAYVRPILDNGTYWAHSENILLSALSDKDVVIRTQAVNQILKIRNNETLKEEVRKKQHQLRQKKKCPYKRQRIFVKPEINYEADSYVNLIRWDDQACHEPPYLYNLSDDEIRAFIMNQLELRIVSNSVLTERTIQMVDKVGTTSTSGSFREGAVRSTLNDQRSKPNLESKADVLGRSNK